MVTVLTVRVCQILYFMVQLLFTSGHVCVAGAITRLQAPNADYVFEFSLVELYGGAHLAFTESVTVQSTRVVGDDTATIIIGPQQTLDIDGVS